MRAFEKTDERLIQSFTTAGIDKALQAEKVRGWVVRFSGDQQTQDFERVVAAQSDHANATTARRSGQGNYCVVRNSHGRVDLRVAKEGRVSVGRSRLEAHSKTAPIPFADRLCK